MIKVKVPATSANMGAGFDTLGVAVSLYNRMMFEEISNGLVIETINPTGFVLQNENNLIYRAMKIVFDEVSYKPRGVRIVQDSAIPVTRGLGSSSACIIGGMIGANVMSGRQLSYSKILDLATQMEGHPDNVAPALYGGFCVSMKDNGKTYTKSYKLNPQIKFAVMIPDYFVATKKSRGLLPEQVSLADAAYNISRASMFQAALVSGNMEMLRAAVDDKLHQPYRKSYVDGMEEIFEKSYEAGAKATYLSGSGPTIVSILDGDYAKFREEMYSFFKENSHRWMCKILSIDNVGTIVSEI